MKKIIAIILELIPIISGIISYLFVFIFKTSSYINAIPFLITFLGFIFFLVARKIYNDRVIKILGILDIICTFLIIVFYILVIFIFGL